MSFSANFDQISWGFNQGYADNTKDFFFSSKDWKVLTRFRGVLVRDMQVINYHNMYHNTKDLFFPQIHKMIAECDVAWMYHWKLLRFHWFRSFVLQLQQNKNFKLCITTSKILMTKKKIVKWHTFEGLVINHQRIVPFSELKFLSFRFASIEAFERREQPKILNFI